jgi:hypothetical protein
MRIAFATLLLITVAACTQTTTDHTHSTVVSPSVTGRANNATAKATVGPTAVQIAANPGKWIGSYVHLNCEIIKVSRKPGVAISSADARCGRGVVASLANFPSKAATKQYNRDLGDQALLELVGDSLSKLGEGQEVSIIGRVTGSSPVTVRVASIEPPPAANE